MKKIALILALILMLTPVLVACEDANPPVDTGSGASSSDQDSELLYSLDDLPEMDFGKKDFTSFSGKNTSGYSSYLVEAETGDLFVDSVYQRKILIEDRYNVNLKSQNYSETDHSGAVRNYILADDKTFHIYSGKMQDPFYNMMMDGYFVDWNEFEALDPSKPYWNQSVVNNMNFGGKIYCMAGDISISTYNFTNSILFNKNLFDDLGIDYPYEDVYNKTWTIDKMIEISKQGYADLDGNTEWDPQADRLGFSGWAYEMNLAVYMGMGGQTLINNEDNMPELAINSDKTVKIIDKMIELFDGVNAYSESGTYGVFNTAFDEGRLLMLDGWITNLQGNRSRDFDAGILPYPMLDEEQENYVCRGAVNCSGAYWVPTTNTQLQETGILLEALSLEGYNRIRPVYYDIQLDLKSAPDTETRDMVDIIMETSSYVSESFIGSMSFSTFINSKFNSFASWYANSERPWRSKIKKLTRFYES